MSNLALGAELAGGALGETIAGRCANQLEVGDNAFRGMAGAGGAAIETLDTSNLDNIEHIFQDAAQFNQNVSTKEVTVNGVTYIAWDISGVDRINSAFWGASAFDNGGEDLYWDTGSVWNMGYTFAKSGFNQVISTREITIGVETVNVWDTATVEFFDNMFNGASRFNQNIGDWNTSSASNMSAMFKGALVFDQNIAGWVTSSVTNMNEMFSGARAFNQPIGTSKTLPILMQAQTPGAAWALKTAAGPVIGIRCQTA